MPQLYTPFVEKTLGNISSAYLGRQQADRQAGQQRQMQQLTQSAYMGDQQAMATLAGVNPQAAQQIQTMQRQTSQDKLAATASQRKGQQDQQKILGGILSEAAKLDTFEEAQSYAAREVEGYGLTGMPPLTEEAYNQVREIARPAEEVSAYDQARIDKITVEVEKIKAETQALKANPPGKKLSDAQAKASGFFNRMESAQSEIDKVLKASPEFEVQSVWEAGPAAISNMFATKEFQQYKQAADDWIRAKLRRESGAVIGEDEMDKEYSTYFPVFGDSDAVIEQKKRARKVAEEGMKLSAGTGVKEKPAATGPELSDEELLSKYLR